MEEAEYINGEKVLYKTKCKLGGFLQTKLEEVDCLVTENHVMIQAQEPMKIPLPCMH